jgi:hypothetical protein
VVPVLLGAWKGEGQGGETETMADARTRREVFLLFFFGFFNVKITFQLFLPCVRFYQILI